MGLQKINAFFNSHPLTRKDKFGAWRRFLSWQLRSRLSGEITVSWVEGQSLVARRGMHGASGNIYTGLHEFADMMMLLHFLRPEDLFFDIGGNIGSFTVLASGVCRARTWVFEPDPQTARDLAKNIELNKLGQLVTLHQIALSDHDGTLSFTVDLNSSNRVATLSNRGSSRTVTARRLDTIAPDVTPIMMKLDVEGHEEQTIRGATSLLSRRELKVAQVESVAPWLLEKLRDEGFVRAFYDPWNRELTNHPNDIPYANQLYVRDWPFVQTRLTGARPINIFGNVI